MYGEMDMREFNRQMLDYVDDDVEAVLDLMSVTSCDDKLIIVNKYLVTAGLMNDKLCDELYSMLPSGKHGCQDVRGYSLVHDVTKLWLSHIKDTVISSVDDKSVNRVSRHQLTIEDLNYQLAMSRQLKVHDDGLVTIQSDPTVHDLVDSDAEVIDESCNL